MSIHRGLEDYGNRPTGSSVRRLDHHTDNLRKIPESSIKRSVISVLDQDEVTLELILVQNGEKFVEGLYRKLQQDKRVNIVYVSEGNVFLARQICAHHISSPFSGFLDDEFLPGALRHRIDEILKDSTVDVIVINGYVFSGEDRPVVEGDVEKLVEQDTALSFSKRNWFT